MKANRREAILKIIEENEIHGQEQLCQMLNEMGFNAAQATISRDIKLLGLIKTVNGYSKPLPLKYVFRPESFFLDAVIGVDYAMNTVVLKCITGAAGAACVELDSQNFKQIVGTVAGDDTVFVLMRTENAAEEFTKQLGAIICSKKFT